MTRSAANSPNFAIVIESFGSLHRGLTSTRVLGATFDSLAENTTDARATEWHE
jgi:hypothetical protein